MKHVFVRYIEDHGDSKSNCIQVVSGQAAESREACVRWLNSGGDSVEITDWFEVPATWENAVASGRVNETFEALLGLDALGETPVVSDLLATIFEAGFRTGARESGKT